MSSTFKIVGDKLEVIRVTRFSSSGKIAFFKFVDLKRVKHIETLPILSDDASRSVGCFNGEWHIDAKYVR